MSEIEENVQTLKRCPNLDPQVRRRLIERATAREDIYAYRSAAGIWNMWIMNVRLRPEEVAV